MRIILLFLCLHLVSVFWKGNRWKKNTEVVPAFEDKTRSVFSYLFRSRLNQICTIILIAVGACLQYLFQVINKIKREVKH